MNLVRTYMQWWMLLAAIVVAMPRTLVHHCDEDEAAHELPITAGDHPVVKHGVCALCDYAAAPALVGVPVVLPLEPSWGSVEPYTGHDEPVASLRIAAALRGPPLA